MSNDTTIYHIDVETAERFLKDPNRIDLTKATSMDDAAAELLSKHQGDLNLERLESMTPKVAYYLGCHRGKFITLTGLTEISDEAANALAQGILDSRRPKSLHINKIRPIPFTLIISHLNEWKRRQRQFKEPLLKYAASGEKLKPKETKQIKESLRSARSPDEIKSALTAFETLKPTEADWLLLLLKGDLLKLLIKKPNRVRVWQSLAQALAPYQRAMEWFKVEAMLSVKFDDFCEDFASQMTPELAPVIGIKTSGPGIAFREKTIEIDHAEVLSSLHCGLIFTDLEELSPELAIVLAKHKGDELRFLSVQKLSEESAKSIGLHNGRLEFDGLREISDGVAKALSMHNGVLALDGLEALSDNAAKYFAQHNYGLSLWGLKRLSKTAEKILHQNDHISIPSFD